MGSVLGGAMKETMDDNMKKNQEFMLATQKIQVRHNLKVEQFCQFVKGLCKIKLLNTLHPCQGLNWDNDQLIFVVSDGFEKFLQ